MPSQFASRTFLYPELNAHSACVAAGTACTDLPKKRSTLWRKGNMCPGVLISVRTVPLPPGLKKPFSLGSRVETPRPWGCRECGFHRFGEGGKQQCLQKPSPWCGGHRAQEYPLRAAEMTQRKAHWVGAGVEFGQSLQVLSPLTQDVLSP